MKVKDILSGKKSGVITVAPHMTLREALRTMIESKVGSLVVIDDSKNPVGIITERDILRFIDRTLEWSEALIGDIMTKKLIIGLVDDEIEVIMEFMTNNFFRHVPILENKQLVGIISIGDIIKNQLKDIKIENRYLSDYIAGKYPA